MAPNYKPEFWVMREVVRWPKERLAQLPMVVRCRDERGNIYEYVNLTDALAEPCEVFTEREPAYEHMKKLEVKHPAEVFRVVFACDV